MYDIKIKINGSTRGKYWSAFVMVKWLYCVVILAEEPII